MTHRNQNKAFKFDACDAEKSALVSMCSKVCSGNLLNKLWFLEEAAKGRRQSNEIALCLVSASTSGLFDFERSSHQSGPSEFIERTILSKTHNGKVKFYSMEKGFGFIFDEVKMVDVFFHITEVEGAEPPSAGDKVSFEISEVESNGRDKARNIKIVASAAIEDTLEAKTRSLQGFPCIRGTSISNFVILENKGKVTAGKPILRWFPAFNTTNDARDALIGKAKALGANAIINYTWHNDRRRAKRAFSKSFYFKDNFWAEGEAVILISG